jgi:hypothetical protein
VLNLKAQEKSQDFGPSSQWADSNFFE